MEHRKAYPDGRLARGPRNFFVDGERGCFDSLVLPPLTEKLSKSGKLEAFADQALVQVEKDRDQWQEKGRENIQELAQRRLVNELEASS